MRLINNLSDFNIIKKNLTNRKATFSIEKRAKATSIHIDKKRAALYRTTSKTNKEYFRKSTNSSIITIVHSKINKYINRKFKAGEVIEAIEQKHTGGYRDTAHYRSLEIGTQLCIIDINHAYWRVAYNLGYIDKQLYDLYAKDNSSKLARNIALSTITSRQERQYFIDGEEFWSVETDNSIHKQVYKNIRQATYNIIGGLHEMLDASSLSYRVDGLTALYSKDIIEVVDQHFKKHKVLYSVTRYVKHTNTLMRNIETDEMKNF